MFTFSGRLCSLNVALRFVAVHSKGNQNVMLGSLGLGLGNFFPAWLQLHPGSVLVGALMGILGTLYLQLFKESPNVDEEDDGQWNWQGRAWQNHNWKWKRWQHSYGEDDDDDFDDLDTTSRFASDCKHPW